MAKIRVNKNKNYSVISNYHLQDKKLSLKAKGLMCLMLSLPENWDYSIKGLTKIVKENETAVINALKELKANGYLVINKLNPSETKSGKYEYVYDIYETPKQDTDFQDLENQALENQDLENQDLENLPLELNTNIINTKNKINNNIYNIYGKFKRIKLTDDEYERLVKDYGKDIIEKQIELLDEYVESNNNKNKYTNFNLVLRRSLREHWFDKNRFIYGKNEVKVKKNDYTEAYKERLKQEVEEL